MRCWRPASPSSPTASGPPSTAAPAWTPPRSRCSAAARPSAPGCAASDPDGGWYVREGDHREREDDKGKPLRKIAWALEATIATTARPPGAAARAPEPRHRPGHGPARRRPRRHRRPGAGLRGRPRAQARLARLRPRLYASAPRALPPPRPGPGLPAGHGLPDRPARHPGKHRRRHPGRGHLVLPSPARAADHRHHPPA